MWPAVSKLRPSPVCARSDSGLQTLGGMVASLANEMEQNAAATENNNKISHTRADFILQSGCILQYPQEISDPLFLVAMSLFEKIMSVPQRNKVRIQRFESRFVA
jgi:hypothetical protein